MSWMSVSCRWSRVGSDEALLRVVKTFAPSAYFGAVPASLSVKRERNGYDNDNDYDNDDDNDKEYDAGVWLKALFFPRGLSCVPEMAG